MQLELSAVVSWIGIIPFRQLQLYYSILIVQLQVIFGKLHIMNGEMQGF